MFDEILWKIVSIVLVIFLLIIFPLMHVYEKQDELIYYRVMDDVDRFVDEIKFKGEIDPISWLAFEQKINSYGYNFDIKFTHDMVEYIPIYDDPRDLSTFSGEMKEVLVSNSNKDIAAVVFPENSTASKDSPLRKYRMNYGDFIVVDVSCNHRTKADILRAMFLRSAGNNLFNIRMSAMISN